MKNWAKEDVVEVSEAEFLLENDCWTFQKECRRDAVLGFCESEREEAGGAELLAGKRGVEVIELFVQEISFWNENLEKAEWVRKKLSSSALRRSRSKAVQKIQRRSCSRWGRDAGSGREGWKR